MEAPGDLARPKRFLALASWAGLLITALSWLGCRCPLGQRRRGSTSTGARILYTAAGDDGHAVGYPAASPNAVGVGGTTLNGCGGTSCASFTSETALSDSVGVLWAYEDIPADQSAYGVPSLR